MKFQAKTTHQLSCNTLTPVFFSTIIVLIFFATSCGQQEKDKTQSSRVNKSDQAIRPTDDNSYLKHSEELINQLDDKKKVNRQTALSELKLNSTYIELVNRQSVDQRFLKVLQAIGECMISLKKDDTFSIPISTEDELKTIPGALQFVVRTLSLEALGGVTRDVLEIYPRYLSKYPVSGDKGATLYAPNAKETIISNYTLTPALVIFQPDNKVYLNDYYEAIQNQLINWEGDSDPDYKYNYLRNKLAFNDYLKIKYPDSKYFFNYALKTTADKLYTDYDANEVSADEIYKGKAIAVSGTITKIAKDIADTPYITLEVSQFGEIQCRFEDTKQLKTLSKGDYVTVIGKCTGKMSVVIAIDDCELF